MESYIYNLMEQINGYPQWCVYLFLHISGWIQVAFPPYPGEVILVFNGCLHSASPVLQCYSYFLAYWVSIVFANYALFVLAYHNGDRLMKAPLVSRILNVKNKEKINRLMASKGFLIYIIAIFIPGFFLPLVFFSGVMKCRKYVVLAGITIATLVHDILLFIGGVLIGNNLKDVSRFISTYKSIGACIIAVVVIIVLAYLFFYNKRDINQQRYDKFTTTLGEKWDTPNSTGDCREAQ